MQKHVNRVLFIFAALSSLVAAWLGGMVWNESRRSTNETDSISILKAENAVSGESFAMATGPIDNDVEGLFTLDYLTGELQCAVINRRTAKFAGLFKANVVDDLGVGQNTKYLMTTGKISLPRGANPARAANSVVYILNANTGDFAAYAIPWRSELATVGRTQQGTMVLLDVGKARNAPIRE